MIDSVFFRKAGYAVHNSWVKGTTNDPRTHPIDEKCFGDWMDPMWAHNWDVVNRLGHGDIWGVHHEDLKQLTSNIWDMIFDNVKYCDVYRLIYDRYSWCLDNIETCKFQKGMVKNVYDNVFPLAGDAMNLWNIVMTDDGCYSDEKLIGEIADATKIVGKMVATLFDYHGKYEHNSHFEKLSFHEMHHNIKSAERATGLKRQCPVKALFHMIEEEFETVQMPTFEMPAFEMAPKSFNPFMGFPAGQGMQFPSLF